MQYFCYLFHFISFFRLSFKNEDSFSTSFPTLPSLKENEEQSDGKDENEVEEGSAIGRREMECQSLLSLPSLEGSSVSTNNNINNNDLNNNIGNNNNNKQKEDIIIYDNYENGAITTFVE